MSDLIDTTQMYLRTIVELEEEGIVPMRARIAERLSQSGPTVSQTVARMERDGLLVVSGDRHLELTALGREAGTRVMRKHRLAECMLVNLLGMEWDEINRQVPKLTLPKMRFEQFEKDGVVFINDAYNANPGSARAAIALLGDVAGSRPRVIVLGTMRELGAASERSHREIAAAALASGAGVVAGIGEFVAALGTVSHGATTVVTAPDVDELWPLLQPLLPSHAAILLKASRGVRLERLVPYLTDWSASPGIR